MVAALALAACTGPGTPPASGAFLKSFIVGVGPPLLWMLLALGVGWPLRMMVPVTPALAMPVQLSLGVAAALWIDSVLGTLGLWRLAGAAGAWVTLLIGAIAGATSLLMAVRRKDLTPTSWSTSWAVGALCASPILGTLLVATTSPPGWLWSSEFGGFDALSYH